MKNTIYPIDHGKKMGSFMITDTDILHGNKNGSPPIMIEKSNQSYFKGGVRKFPINSIESVSYKDNENDISIKRINEKGKSKSNSFTFQRPELAIEIAEFIAAELNLVISSEQVSSSRKGLPYLGYLAITALTGYFLFTYALAYSQTGDMFRGEEEVSYYLIALYKITDVITPYGVLAIAVLIAGLIIKNGLKAINSNQHEHTFSK